MILVVVIVMLADILLLEMCKRGTSSTNVIHIYIISSRYLYIRLNDSVREKCLLCIEFE